MSRFFDFLIAAIIAAVFSSSPVFSAEIDDSSDKIITGILIKVDLRKQSIYVRENSRTVKFKASAEICEKFKDRINALVDITYKIGTKKSLQIVTIAVSGKKVEVNKTDIVPKTFIEGKSKK